MKTEMPDASALFASHLEHCLSRVEEALECARNASSSFGGVVFHSGRERHYHADDLALPFRSLAHFARLAPVAGPDHLLVVDPGRRPRLFRVVPRGYWYGTPEEPAPHLAEQLDISVVGSREEAARALAGSLAGYAFVGDDPALADLLGIQGSAIEAPALLRALDWFRGEKSAYERACIGEAVRIASLGHAAARRAGAGAESERAIHRRFLEAADLLEVESPYPNIVAVDRHAAILHYEGRSACVPDAPRSLLVDAGATARGYASDITRSYAWEAAPAPFVFALARMESLQRELVAQVRPGLDFVELHEAAIRGVGEILIELGVLRTSLDEALGRGLVGAFLPHGLGHHLGLQVHDVGGRQQSPADPPSDPPAEYPNLRTTRRLEAGQVVTIEPGLYFIPALLEDLEPGAIDRALVDRLMPCGGIRIEDDVAVTVDGCENLSADRVPLGSVSGPR